MRPIPVVHLLILMCCHGLPWKQAESSGCFSGRPSYRLVQGALQACPGEWSGHIGNGSHLCAPGWRVCSWRDQKLLKQISWQNASNVEGCYAYNAAQDGATCQECRDDIESDDLAGLGRGCPHQVKGQSSCITGGHMAASCCVDSHFKKACVYRAGLASGVLCCRTAGMSSSRRSHKRQSVIVQSGDPLTMACDIRGHRSPTVHWYKDGVLQHKHGDTHQGKLLINSATQKHSGKYRCVARSDVGQSQVITMVTVKGSTSDCVSLPSNGGPSPARIRACRGSWSGHISNAGHLCGSSWHVCDSRDAAFLNSVQDLKNVGGCYAVDISPEPHCGNCREHGFSMAAVGQSCPHQERSSSSACLSHVITEIRRARHHRNCVHLKTVTSGVLCCRH